jgi:tRNA/tmRNA/rRNA uracil-C5-methylase (TrmA/RlmC/RlmD family)
VQAEDELPKLLDAEAAKYESVVAIVDPPRAGLHKTVLKNLLKCSQVRGSCRAAAAACGVVNLAGGVDGCGKPGGWRAGLVTD